MPTQLIAVAMLPDGTLAPHAGRAEIWQVYTVENPLEPQLEWTLNLDSGGTLHEWHVRDDGHRHPLHGCDIAIAQSAGDGVVRRLAERGTLLVTTTEKFPLRAISTYLDGRLAPGLPHEEQPCLHPDTKVG